MSNRSLFWFMIMSGAYGCGNIPFNGFYLYIVCELVVLIYAVIVCVGLMVISHCISTVICFSLIIEFRKDSLCMSSTSESCYTHRTGTSVDLSIMHFL